MMRYDHARLLELIERCKERDEERSDVSVFKCKAASLGRRAGASGFYVLVKSRR
jgi:hypothetical protein